MSRNKGSFVTCRVLKCLAFQLRTRYTKTTFFLFPSPRKVSKSMRSSGERLVSFPNLHNID